MVLVIMEKGDKTRARIIEAAKHEFYNNGYNKVTMTGLTNILGYQSSWISYYFKKKENLVAEIMLELDTVLNDCIQTHFPNIKNPLTIRFLEARELYLLLWKDLKYRRYRHELAKKNVTMLTNQEFIADKYSNILDYYALLEEDITQLYVKNAIRQYNSSDDNSFDSSLFKHIHSVLNNHTIVNLCSNSNNFEMNNIIGATSLVERVVPLLMGIPFDEVQKADEESLAYVSKIDTDEFNILKRAVIEK